VLPSSASVEKFQGGEGREREKEREREGWERERERERESLTLTFSSWVLQTSRVLPALRSSSDSPMQYITCELHVRRCKHGVGDGRVEGEEV